MLKIFVILIALSISNISMQAASHEGIASLKVPEEYREPKDFKEAQQLWKESEEALQKIKKERESARQEMQSKLQALNKNEQAGQEKFREEYDQAVKNWAAIGKLEQEWAKRQEQLEKNALVAEYTKSLSQLLVPSQSSSVFQRITTQIAIWLKTNIQIPFHRFLGNKEKVFQLYQDLGQLYVTLGDQTLVDRARNHKKMASLIDEINPRIANHIIALQNYRDALTKGVGDQKAIQQEVTDTVRDLIVLSKELGQEGIDKKNQQIAYKEVDALFKELGFDSSEIAAIKYEENVSYEYVVDLAEKIAFNFLKLNDQKLIDEIGVTEISENQRKQVTNIIDELLALRKQATSVEQEKIDDKITDFLKKIQDEVFKNALFERVFPDESLKKTEELATVLREQADNISSLFDKNPDTVLNSEEYKKFITNFDALILLSKKTFKNIIDEAFIKNVANNISNSLRSSVFASIAKAGTMQMREKLLSEWFDLNEKYSGLEADYQEAYNRFVKTEGVPAKNLPKEKSALAKGVADNVKKNLANLSATIATEESFAQPQLLEKQYKSFNEAANVWRKIIDEALVSSESLDAMQHVLSTYETLLNEINKELQKEKIGSLELARIVFDIQYNIMGLNEDLAVQRSALVLVQPEKTKSGLTDIKLELVQEAEAPKNSDAYINSLKPLEVKKLTEIQIEQKLKDPNLSANEKKLLYQEQKLRKEAEILERKDTQRNFQRVLLDVITQPLTLRRMDITARPEAEEPLIVQQLRDVIEKIMVSNASENTEESLQDREKSKKEWEDESGAK